MKNQIDHLLAEEILDSRGNPTVQAKVILTSRITAIASVPSGASTGHGEAFELRDQDPNRFRGKGVLNRYIAQLSDSREQESLTLPVPMLNVLNGGRHASNNLAFQEFMVYPTGAMSFAQALRFAAEIFQQLKSLLYARGFSTAVGDEGGFAPELKNHEEALELIVRAIQEAGYKPGKEVSLALDPAASQFYKNSEYTLGKDGHSSRNPSGMGELYVDLVSRYPIMSIEDGVAEDDWEGWILLTRILGNRVQLVGDDVFVTNTEHLQRGIDEGIANAILIKPNQIGTLTETLDAIALARKAGYGIVVSHRFPSEKEGDGYARLRVLFGECLQSLKLMQQCLKGIDGGPVRMAVPIRPGATLAWTETPRGAAFHWVRLTDEGKVARYRIVPPSFANWLGFHLAAENFAFQDFPIILATFNLSVAENDR